MGQGTMPRGRPDPFRAGGVFHEKRAAGRGFPGWGGGVRRTVPSQGIGGRGTAALFICFLLSVIFVCLLFIRFCGEFS